MKKNKDKLEILKWLQQQPLMIVEDGGIYLTRELDISKIDSIGNIIIYDGKETLYTGDGKEELLQTFKNFREEVEEKKIRDIKYYANCFCTLECCNCDRVSRIACKELKNNKKLN